MFGIFMRRYLGRQTIKAAIIIKKFNYSRAIKNKKNK